MRIKLKFFNLFNFLFNVYSIMNNSHILLHLSISAINSSIFVLLLLVVALLLLDYFLSTQYLEIQFFSLTYSLNLINSNKYNRIGNPTIDDNIVIIVRTFFSSDINNTKSLYPKIPMNPPKQFKIISSISAAPIHRNN